MTTLEFLDVDDSLAVIAAPVPSCAACSVVWSVVHTSEAPEREPSSGSVTVAEIKDFSPLVANTGLGAGDTIYATPFAVDCASFKADFAPLTSRGVTFIDAPSCP